MSISYPEDHPHPLFADQREYALCRAMIDTGDETTEAFAVLTFRHHKTGRLRRFRFTGVTLADGYLGRIGEYPIYVATLEGRGWAGLKIEVGDSDPGGEWFWAAELEEIT
jgi:hypothetical protein